MYRYILFDLDGTLTDPWEGITKCVQHALASFGIDEPQDNLTHFIGPPLLDSFQTCYGFSRDEAEEAVRMYRERFGTVGMLENQVYDGVPELLGRLRAAGAALALATSKPEQYAVAILEHFGLAACFDVVVGSNMDGSRTRKGEVVREALRRLGFPDAHEAVMVGDRKHDVEGAREQGVACIGVTWGYAPEGELEAARPRHLAHTFEALERLLLETDAPALAKAKEK